MKYRNSNKQNFFGSFFQERTILTFLQTPNQPPHRALSLMRQDVMPWSIIGEFRDAAKLDRHAGRHLCAVVDRGGAAGAG
jgi:hypothetical protein